MADISDPLFAHSPCHNTVRIVRVSVLKNVGCLVNHSLDCAIIWA